MGSQITMRSAKLASIESRQQLIIYNFNADKRGENSPIAGLEDLLFNVFFFHVDRSEVVGGEAFFLSYLFLVFYPGSLHEQCTSKHGAKRVYHGVLKQLLGASHENIL